MKYFNITDGTQLTLPVHPGPPVLSTPATTLIPPDGVGAP